jgi:hypothetical protein
MEQKMSSIVQDTAVVVAATGTIGILLIGSVYYLTPSWESIGAVIPQFQPLSSYVPSMDTVEDTVASIVTLPVNVAARVGSKFGASIMKASGWTYTASELAELRPSLFAEANIPNTPANAAQRIYELMAEPGQLEQLEKTVVDLIGPDGDWNRAVVTAYFAMYGTSIQADLLIYDL